MFFFRKNTFLLERLFAKNFGFRCSLMLMGLLTICSCNVTKHLDTAKGERLLVKNALKIHAEKRLGISAKTALSNELTPYFRQKPNRRNLGFFYTRLSLYYKFRNKKSDLAKWINKRIAEPPVVYDSIMAQRTALNFKNQMRQKGYSRAEASFKTTLIGKYKAKTTYQLTLGPRYTVQHTQFVSRDSAILQILQATASESLIKQGTPLDVQVFDAEKLRITTILKNRGYAYFIPQYIEYGGDSSNTKANIVIEVLPFNDSTQHKVYTIGNVEVLSGVVPNLSSMRRETTIEGVYFAAAESKLWIRPSLLRKKILIAPGDLFQQSAFDQTLRNLNALGVYRFVSLRPVQDSTEKDKINVVVNLSPNQRFSPGADLDLNYLRNSISSNGLLGLAPIFYLQNRNLLSGAEHLQSSVSYTAEFDITNPRLVFSQEFKFQNELSFPRFFDYFGLWKLGSKVHLGKKHLVPKNFYNRMRSDGEARLSMNYNYLNVTDFYAYHLSNVTFGYRVRSHPEHQYNWDHIGLDVLRPKFDSLLVPGEFLRRSFGNQLFTGLLLRSFNYAYATRPNRFGERWNYRFNSELSGLEVLAANSIWPLFSGQKEPVWRIGDLDFAKFLRLDQEAIYTRNFTKDLVGAVRIGAGVSVPFGDTRAVPFVKQFFVGGPSSLRAWRIRELGPGGFVPRDDNNVPQPFQTQPFYQAADFRFEFGGELRFPLFLWFKGAVFIDGGNIWTLQFDATRPASKLQWDSYKNIAIGTGLGLRMDLDYFVLRMDFGVPLRRPYADANGHGYWVKDFFKNVRVNPNLAVGYPF